MNEQQVAQAVADWLDELIPDLTASYPFTASRRTTLPDVMVDVENKQTQRGGADAFPFSQLQQVDLRVFEVHAYFMVERGAPDDPEADRLETEQLRAFGAAMEDSMDADATLGERVQMVSPVAIWDYSLPFIQYQDGTRGRQMEAVISVGEVKPTL